VRSPDLRDAISAVRALGLRGINVTVPHKEGVARHLDAVGDGARRVGAVNTIVNQNGRLRGENTDVTGFLAALRSMGVGARGRRAVVIGAGGSARAVVAALTGAGATAVVVANRTRRRAVRLARAFATDRTPIQALDLGELALPERLKGVRLVVNTTSVGLQGEEFPPLAAEATAADCLFFDLVYGARTSFVARAAASGRTCCDGSEMLLHQGAAAFRLWTGKAAPLAVMRRALREA
jgi:shikimate dehydrogenase